MPPSELSEARRRALLQRPSGVTCTVDLDAPGPAKQWGRLLIPASDNFAGWRNLAVPICVVAGAAPGSDALVMAGNHGDEYEPQVVVSNLAREVRPEDLRGRLIIIPTLSGDASRGGTRCWPTGENFNRCFPGDPSGPPALQLAYFISHALMPRVDTVIDLHTGGRTMAMLPMAVLHQMADPAQAKAMADAAEAMLLPTVFYYTDVAGTGLLPNEAEAQGKTVVCTELGGGGYCAAATHRLATRGLANVLRHLGLLRGDATTRGALGEAPVRTARAVDRDDYVFAPLPGMWEACVDPGADVVKGQLLGRIHFFPDEPQRTPVPVLAPRAGLVTASRAITSTRGGDCVAVIADAAPAPRRSNL